MLVVFDVLWSGDWKSWRWSGLGVSRVFRVLKVYGTPVSDGRSGQRRLTECPQQHYKHVRDTLTAKSRP